MSLTGSLEDVTVADVMQFVYLGRSTGTLELFHDDLWAKVGFHFGDIVSAQVSGHVNVGDLLLQKGLIDEATLEAIAARQAASGDHIPMGDLLVDEGRVAEDDVRKALVQQVRAAIIEVFPWTRGRFSFTRDTPAGIGLGTSKTTQQRIERLKIGTEGLLLEAAQFLDESRGTESERQALEIQTPSAQTSDPQQEDQSFEDTQREAILETAAQSVAQQHAPDIHPLIDLREGLICEVEALTELSPLEIRSRDQAFSLDVATAVNRDEDLCTALSAPGARWLLIDVRDGGMGIPEIAQASEEHPRPRIIAIIDNVGLAATTYERGAEASVAADPQAVTSCLKSLVCRPGADVAGPPKANISEALERLRRIVSEIRSGSKSTTSTLTLMKFVGEVVERAVVLLVEKSSLRTIGAFGFDQQGRPLAETMRGTRLDRAPSHALTQAAKDGLMRHLPLAEARLPSTFIGALGRPAFEEILVVPVIGVQRVIAVIYADNANLREPIRDAEVLEIAGVQVGAALENELLRRQLTRSRALEGPS